MENSEKIVLVNIEDQMKTAYIDYSMSVIVSRALPDVRDGLKPVHRRVLFGMNELGNFANRPYKKSARIVGEVLGKYHPHGDTSVYDAMVRMAQEWSLRYPLVDGQGNFGSMDGDSAAAMRYTEARMKKITEEMLADLDKDTVDFQLNFDDTLEEPTVMPAKIPNLLINGASGIAVGMATNMPPHNLSEVVDGTLAYIDNKEITIEELMAFIKAPDFPTGGVIYGYDGVKEAYHTGRGRILIRGEVTIEKDEKDYESLIVTSIPYQVNKAEMIARTYQLVEDKKIEGISAIRDESDRSGLRIVYVLKKDAIANVVLNNLYKHTALQSSFNVNNIALVNGRPMTLNLKDIIANFIKHRHNVIIRRTKYELKEAEKRAHILEGLLIALDNIDEVINIIRSSKTVDDAKTALMDRFSLSDVQARAIVDMRLRTLVGLERDKLKQEYDELIKLIAHLNEILGNEALQMDIIKKELLEIKEKYGDEPKTDIIYNASEFSILDTIPDDTVVIT
ncbi:MAG: DNA topoisomerase 4 subunit A, partial [Bacteroidales bacterium]|nr:DNA topoisomerase 4 subunit A [Bacteroidales bacterium]